MLKITEEEKSYIAGILDGDGCVNAQIVRRPDYQLKFQIRVSISFLQKTKRHWFLIWLKKKLRYGTIRKRPDGVSEYAIIGNQAVKRVLETLWDHLKLKKKQSFLVLNIIKKSTKKQDFQTFLKLCESVDKFSSLNDTKERIITSLVVKEESTNIFEPPVETENLS